MPAPVPSFESSQSFPPKTFALTVLLFMVAALFARSLIEFRLSDAGFSAATAKHLSALAGFVILGVLASPLLLNKRSAVRTQFRQPSSWSRLILASVALGFVAWIGQMLSLLAVTPLKWPDTSLLTAPTTPIYAFSCQNKAIFWLAIPVMAVATPIVEETIHRGIILRSLLPTGRAKAILLSAALFAILHKPAAIPYAFVFGALLSLQMIFYGNLWAVIITHAVTNLLVVISATCIDGYWRPGLITWEALSPATLIIVSLIACLVAAWVLVTRIAVGADSVRSAPTSLTEPSQRHRRHVR